MNVYERIKPLCKEKGVSISKMERDLGLAKSASAKWQKFTPNAETVNKLAQYFGVSSEFILTGKESDGYYLCSDVVEIAQAVYDRPEMKILFDATENVAKEDIEFVIEMLGKMKGK